MRHLWYVLNTYHEEVMATTQLDSEEVVVVIHEAGGMAEPAVAGDPLGEDAQKRFALRLIQKDPLTGGAAGDEMINCARVLEPQGTGHERTSPWSLCDGKT